MTTIALFGGSGRVGRLVLSQALDAGYTVRSLARSAASIDATSPHLTVIEGNVLDAKAVETTIDGADVVISVVGNVKGAPATVQAEGTANMIAAMKQHGLTRIVSLSGGGLPFEKDKPKLPDRIIRRIMRLTVPDVLDDAIAHHRLLEGSGLDWTIVRGPVLTDGPLTSKYRVGWVGIDAGLKIGRADLAQFILKQVSDESYRSQLPFVSY